MKNTLLFLNVEGIGLNKRWKGNCLKLADKPNINHLISGIYPWATLSNAKKKNKFNVKKEYDSVSTDIDKNFYQMLHGNSDALTLNEKIAKAVEEKTFVDNQLFADLANNANTTNNKYVHVFFLLSNNIYHCSIDNFKYILNALVKKGLVPILHLIADGKEDAQYSFDKHLKELTPFLVKRNIHVGSISGRNHAFIQHGRDYLNSVNVNKYFEMLCGMSNKSFVIAKDYSTENLFNKVKDQDILPAFNSNIDKYYLDKNDAVLFIDSDYDNYSPLLNLIKSEKRFSNVYFASTNRIYGNDVNSIMFESYDEYENSLTNIASKNNLKTLVISVSHKKGFVSKYYGFNKNPNVTKKIIRTDYTQNDLDYIFSVNKLIIDAAKNAIGKYDLVIVHVPTIAEAAFEGNLKLLKFAIENFDKNLGRIVNYMRVTGNVIAFSSPYGVSEKMLNKKLEIIPNIKSSIVPFVFTNGSLSSKSLKSNFVSIYSTLLVTLGLENLDESIYRRSLITRNYNMNIIHKKLVDHYDVWKNDLAQPITEQFEKDTLCLYADISKDKAYLTQKQQYVVIKEIMNLHDKVFTTPDARKMIFEKLLAYVQYNGIDFIGFKYNYAKMLMTLFDDEIKLARLSGFTYRFFDNHLWRTQIKRNDKWFNKVKSEILPSFNRSVSESRLKKIVHQLEVEIEPYQYFERLFKAEKEVLTTNDANKVTEFYDSIKDEVAEVYQQYFANKIPSEDEVSYSDNQEENNKRKVDFEKIVSYYELFLEVIDFVNSNREKADVYNQKYFENRQVLIDGGNYDANKELDIYTANAYELNYLVRKIVNIYSQWRRATYTIVNETLKPIRNSMNRYNNRYSKRYNNALSGVTYEGEFLDGVDLNNQEIYESMMNQKIKDVGFFDVPMLLTDEDDNEDKYVAAIDLEPNMVKEVDNNISVRALDDKSELWYKKRYDEIKNVNNISPTIVYDAENAVITDKKLKESRRKLEEYNNLSSSWTKNKSGQQKGI